MVRFILNSILLGVGLAMDAFSVSMADGLKAPEMPGRRIAEIAGTFAGFQFLMPVIGWFCVHELIEHFRVFQPYVPWIALILLVFIGGKMLWEGLRGEGAEEAGVGGGELLLQGIATSIDALSVGFTIATYDVRAALGASSIIAVVTFIICVAGVKIGQRLGMKLASKASVLGGVILIAIGLEICFF